MSAPQKSILIFTSSFPHPGNPVSGIFVEELAREQAKVFRVVVLAPAVGKAPRQEDRDGMRIIRFRQGVLGIELAGQPGGILPALSRNRWLIFLLPFFLLAEFVALIRTVRSEKIHLIHAHWLLPQGLIAALYCAFWNRRIKLLITCHGSDLLKVSGKISGVFKRFALRHADAVTVVSGLLASKVAALSCKKCSVLPMGIDTDLFSPEAAVPGLSEQYGLKRNVILFVGSLIELKGVRALVDAMPEVLRHEPDTSLLLVGGGELEQELRERVTRNGVGEHVVFAGSQLHTDLPKFFAGSDLFILPSFSEGWPLVVMEALSSGLTVVVSKLPVFMDHPERDNLFLTVTAGDSVDIAKGLLQALQKEGNKENARAYAVQEFDLKVVGSRYASLITEVLFSS